MTDALYEQAAWALLQSELPKVALVIALLAPGLAARLSPRVQRWRHWALFRRATGLAGLCTCIYLFPAAFDSYALESRSETAVVLKDCYAQDVRRNADGLVKSLSCEDGETLKVGIPAAFNDGERLEVRHLSWTKLVVDVQARS